MTESEWLASTNVDAMLEIIRATASDRKLRLFACSCCYGIWQKLTDERSCRAVKVAELYADGLATTEELKAARDAAWAARDACGAAWGAAWGAARDAAWAARDAARDATWAAWAARDACGAAWGAAWGARAACGAAWDAARTKQADILRCIVGSPFRQTNVSPDWLVWREATIARLAKHIYWQRDWATLPILADALEEASCQDRGILQHLREPGPHARGCWVLDLVLKPRGS